MEKNTTEGVPTPEKSYDEKKIEALYRELQPFAKYTAMATNRGDLGEDLSQEFVVIWLEIQAKDGHKFNSLEPHEQFFYLKAVIRNRLIAMLKKEGRFIYDDTAESLADETNEPYRVLVERLKDEIWEVADQVLTENQLSVFELRCAGHSFKDIAKITGLKEGGCRQSFHGKILPKLKSALEKRGLI